MVFCHIELIRFSHPAHCDSVKRKMCGHFTKQAFDRLMKKVSLCSAQPSVTETQPDGIQANSALKHNYGDAADIYSLFLCELSKIPCGNNIFFTTNHLLRAIKNYIQAKNCKKQSIPAERNIESLT